MKKILAIMLLAAFVAPVFADDAIMLPESVWRFRVIPSVTFSSAAFDDDGERQDYEEATTGYDGLQVYNLSMALEYGINPWITAALQWTPGWRMGTNFDNPANEDLVSKGLNDLFVGAKFQIVGEEAPVPNEMMRFAAATGVIVPLTTFDAEEEGEAAFEGDEFKAERVDKDALGLGWRLYYDYVFSGNFFVNFYNEFIYYVPTDQDNSVSGWATYYGTEAVAPGAGTEPEEVEYEYGYDLTFELEPQYSQMIGEGVELNASLPLTYTMAPETKVDGNGLDNESYTFSVGPSLSFFLQNTPWPIDLELAYSTPLVGKNSGVNNTLVLQVKNYLKFW